MFSVEALLRVPIGTIPNRSMSNSSWTSSIIFASMMSVWSPDTLGSGVVGPSGNAWRLGKEDGCRTGAGTGASTGTGAGTGTTGLSEARGSLVEILVSSLY